MKPSSEHSVRVTLGNKDLLRLTCADGMDRAVPVSSWEAIWRGQLAGDLGHIGKWHGAGAGGAAVWGTCWQGPISALKLVAEQIFWDMILILR